MQISQISLAFQNLACYDRGENRCYCNFSTSSPEYAQANEVIFVSWRTMSVSWSGHGSAYDPEKFGTPRRSIVDSRHIDVSGHIPLFRLRRKKDGETLAVVLLGVYVALVFDPLGYEMRRNRCPYQTAVDFAERLQNQPRCSETRISTLALPSKRDSLRLGLFTQRLYTGLGAHYF